ncbi:MAG: hypothetical protein AAGJ79_06570 [Verrucomicrobiota bacterium]
MNMTTRRFVGCSSEELWSCSFFGHWRTVDFLLVHGAEVNSKVPGCEESALHCALCKPGCDYYAHTVRLVLDHGDRRVDGVLQAGW